MSNHEKGKAAQSVPAIQAQALTKSYGKARGIVDVDLCIEQGDIFGFIGPNGAGKSTFIRTLLGLISPSSGSAQVLGFDCVREKKAVLAQVGYMPSEAQFYHGMKVKDVLGFSASLRKKDCSKRAAQLCERLDLDPGRKVNELSLGNRKKVSIVCALQHNPRLYILDEPTSGLDPLIQKEFFSVLMESHTQGATILLSSHVLSEVQRYCHNAAIIREGKIVVSGAVESLSSTTARRVYIRGPHKLSLSEGVKDLHVDEDGMGFLYQGDMKKLISAINELDVSDVTIEEPDIEEVFMHFYSRGD